ncbi:MAG: hypothetical protein SVY53_05420 [Chloroflexota bacterium]|nr:hypothetical protein [Chloroflexota bacterium]
MEYQDMINNGMVVIEDNCAKVKDIMRERDYAQIIVLCENITFMANAMKKVAKDAKREGNNSRR